MSLKSFMILGSEVIKMTMLKPTGVYFIFFQTTNNNTMLLLHVLSDKST